MWMPWSGHDLSGYMEPLPRTDLHWSEVSDKNLALKKSWIDEQAASMKEHIFYQSNFISPQEESVCFRKSSPLLAIGSQGKNEWKNIKTG